MDITNGTDIVHLKEILLLDGGDNSLFYKSQAHGFLMAVNDISKHHIVKKYMTYPTS